MTLFMSTLGNRISRISYLSLDGDRVELLPVPTMILVLVTMLHLHGKKISRRPVGVSISSALYVSVISNLCEGERFDTVKVSCLFIALIILSA